jgi:hypothetical protein
MRRNEIKEVIVVQLRQCSWEEHKELLKPNPIYRQNKGIDMLRIMQ